MAATLSAPALNDWQGTIDGLLIGEGTAYDIVAYEGWSNLPDVVSRAVKRPSAHGRFPGDEWADKRVLTLDLEIASPPGAAFVALVQALKHKTTIAEDGPAFDLWYKLPGIDALHLYAKCSNRDIENGVLYERGLAKPRIEFTADDSLMRNASVTQQVVFPVPNGGLEFPLFDGGVLDFGEAGDDGNANIINLGNTPIAPRFTITGPVPSEGFEILEIGGDAHLKFEGAIASGAVLEIDAATGTVILDGVADRSRLLAKRQWPLVPAESSTTLLFNSLGAATAATCTVTYESGWM